MEPLDLDTHILGSMLAMRVVDFEMADQSQFEVYPFRWTLGQAFRCGEK
jgi:hypothetical protein